MTEKQLEAFKRSAERRGITLEEALSEVTQKSHNISETPIKKEVASGCSSCRAAKEARKVAQLAAKIGKAIVNPDADETLIKERLSICDGCPFKTTILGIDQCSKCSCLISLKTKLVSESCPESKW